LVSKGITATSFFSLLKLLLPAQYREEMKAQAAKFRKDWIKEHFQDQADLLSPWWCMVSTFDSFTQEEHTDDYDRDPSFLFNFGQPCILHLRSYGVGIPIQPLDVVLFNTKLDHWTEAADDGEGKRWAFAGFYRERVFECLGPQAIAEPKLKEVSLLNTKVRPVPTSH